MVVEGAEKEMSTLRRITYKIASEKYAHEIVFAGE